MCLLPFFDMIEKPKDAYLCLQIFSPAKEFPQNFIHYRWPTTFFFLSVTIGLNSSNGELNANL